MARRMKIANVRAKQITLYCQTHPRQEVKEQRVPVQIEGRTEYRRVWKLPHKLLSYNIRNGRFASELLAKEASLKRKLNPHNKEDAKLIRKLLLDQNPNETQALTENLKEFMTSKP